MNVPVGGEALAAALERVGGRGESTGRAGTVGDCSWGGVGELGSALKGEGSASTTGEGECRADLAVPLRDRLGVRVGDADCSKAALAENDAPLAPAGDAPRVSGVGCALPSPGARVGVGVTEGVVLPEREVVLVEEGEAPRVSEAVGDAESVLLALGGRGKAAAALGEAGAASGDALAPADRELLGLAALLVAAENGCDLEGASEEECKKAPGGRAALGAGE